MGAQEEALRLRKELVALRESHARKLLPLSSTKGPSKQFSKKSKRDVESSSEDPPPSPPARPSKSKSS